MTKDELLEILAEKRKTKIKPTWGQFLAMLNKLGDSDKATILTFLSGPSHDAAKIIGEVILKAALKDAKNTAIEDIGQKTKNGSISLADLQELF